MFFKIFQNEKTPFWAIKTRSSKTPKIDNFPKWLTHSFGSKMAIFPTYFFNEIQARKTSFTLFQNEKTPLQGIKKRSLKSPKIDIFPKGLTDCFGPKMAIFPTFFFWQCRRRECFLRYSRTKEGRFWAIKTRSSKSPKIDIFPKGLTHGFGSKMPIFQTFLFRQYRPGKCFLGYSRRNKHLSRV